MQCAILYGGGSMLGIITLICLQIAPGAKVPIEKCEAYYTACVQELANLPGAKEKGLTEEKIASALYHHPKSRNDLCK
jgi:hypothetical protein